MLLYSFLLTEKLGEPKEEEEPEDPPLKLLLYPPL